MAGKYPQQPPPYQAGPPPPHNTIIVQGQPQQTVVVQQSRPGIVGSFLNTAASATKDVWKAVDPAGYRAYHRAEQSMTTNNVVQFISRVSGKSLQVVQAQNGQLAIDGRGFEGPDPKLFNTHWTVFRESGHVVRLHNNFNYLAIANGSTVVMNFPAGMEPSAECRFWFTEQENFILLESCKEAGRYVGIMPDGSLKPAVACGREQSAHFGCRLIHSPYGMK